MGHKQPSIVDRHQLETPCIVIDASIMEANIRRMADAVQRLGVRLRPHAKTHKIPEFARAQVAAGAAGITVAKISEAEVMADHGIDDIFVAYPLVTASKIDRALRLSERIRLCVGVDSETGARSLEDAAARSGRTLRVRLEIDTGLKRTGAPYGEAVKLAQLIHGLPHLELEGIYTFRGNLLGSKPTLDLRGAGYEEGRLMVSLAEQMRSQGIPIREVSVGSTPTALYAGEVKGVTEVRPGTYIFYDRMQAKLGVCTPQDCAAVVWATVVSRPSDTLAIIDGGSKTFATDVQPDREPLNLSGFGYIPAAPDAVLERLTEEHGMIRAHAGDGLQIGSKVGIIPNHICSTLNLHNRVYLLENGGIREIAVSARGMLE
jgi:D-serine deaminase-like pyridoxal phosphate-dependent protein